MVKYRWLGECVFIPPVGTVMMGDVLELSDELADEFMQRGLVKKVMSNKLTDKILRTEDITNEDKDILLQGGKE